jgi:hypothetical protein
MILVYLVSIYLWLLMSRDPYIYVLSIYIDVNLSIQYANFECLHCTSVHLQEKLTLHLFLDDI